MNKKKVCHISTVHPLFSPRILYKELASIRKEGYDSYYIVKNKKNEEINGIKIIGLPIIKNTFVRIIILPFIAFRYAYALKADLYHFHDPELLLVGALLKIFTTGKVIFDIHEYIRDQILNKKYLGPLFIRKIIKYFYVLIEKIALFFFIDGIIVVSTEMKKDYKMKKNALVRNFPIVSLIKKAEPIDLPKKVPVVIYPGRLSHQRGILFLIQAMGLLKGKVELWLIGTWENKEFQKKCSELYGWQYTKYFGRLQLEEVFKYMKSADIGVQLTLPVGNYLRSHFPTKVLEFFASDTSVIISDMPEIRKLFNSCALFVNPMDPDDIANSIHRLIETPGLRDELIHNGNKLVDSYGSWEKESNNLIQFYFSILK